MTGQGLGRCGGGRGSAGILGAVLLLGLGISCPHPAHGAGSMPPSPPGAVDAGTLHLTKPWATRPLFGLDAYCGSREHWPEPSCIQWRRQREEENARQGLPGPIFLPRYEDQQLPDLLAPGGR